MLWRAGGSIMEARQRLDTPSNIPHPLLDRGVRADPERVARLQREVEILAGQQPHGPVH